jgi:hypothetical protein
MKVEWIMEEPGAKQSWSKQAIKPKKEVGAAGKAASFSAGATRDRSFPAFSFCFPKENLSLKEFVFHHQFLFSF